MQAQPTTQKIMTGKEIKFYTQKNYSDIVVIVNLLSLVLLSWFTVILYLSRFLASSSLEIIFLANLNYLKSVIRKELMCDKKSEEKSKTIKILENTKWHSWSCKNNVLSVLNPLTSLSVLMIQVQIANLGEGDRGISPPGRERGGQQFFP